MDLIFMNICKSSFNQQDKDEYNPFDMLSPMGYFVSDETDTKLDIYNTKTSHRIYPLLVALNGDFRNIVKYLIDKFDYLNGQKDTINTKSKSGKSALWFAALNDNLEMLKLFESHPECDFNSHDNRSHWSPLFAAVCKSNWRSAELLINQEKWDVNTIIALDKKALDSEMFSFFVLVIKQVVNNILWML